MPNWDEAVARISDPAGALDANKRWWNPFIRRTPVVVTGGPGAGKTEVWRQLTGGEAPDAMSKKVDKGYFFAAKRESIAIITIAGQASAERFEDLNYFFDPSTRLDGVVFVGAYGFDAIWPDNARTVARRGTANVSSACHRGPSHTIAGAACARMRWVGRSEGARAWQAPSGGAMVRRGVGQSRGSTRPRISATTRPASANRSAAPESAMGRSSSMSRTIVRTGRLTTIMAGGSYFGARLAPGKSTGVSPAFGAGATGWAKSAGVSPTRCSTAAGVWCGSAGMACPGAAPPPSARQIAATAVATKRRWDNIMRWAPSRTA
jgi:hypothetical protein